MANEVETKTHFILLVAKSDAFLFGVLITVALTSYLISVWVKCPYEALDPCRKWFTDEGGITMLLLIGSFSILLFDYLFIAIFVSRRFPVFPYGLFWLAGLFVVWNSASGYDFIDHGGYNRLVLTGSVVIVAFVCGAWKLISLLVSLLDRFWNPTPRKLKKVACFGLLAICIFSVLITRNCRASQIYWLNPTLEALDVHFNQSTCSFPKPTYHWWNVLRGVFNFAYWSPCSGYDVSWLNLPDDFSGTLLYAYPTLNDITVAHMSSYLSFANFALGRVKLIEEREVESYESVLKIAKKSKPSLTVKVVRNESLVSRAKRKTRKKANKKNGVLQSRDNIMIFLIDALSRQAFTRNLPKTFDYLRGLGTNEPNVVHTFMKFHSIRPFTGPNCEPMRYGVSFDTFASRPTNECQRSIFHSAVDNGYVTGYAGSLCNYNELEIEDVVRTCLPPHDHKLAFCDPNIFDPNNPFSFLKGGFSMLKRCLYGKPVHQYIMDYATSFWEQYPDVPKFFMTYISDAHEWTGELVQYMDENLVTFLQSFEKHLPNTTIFLLSDHGNHLNGMFRLLKPDGPEIEMKTPVLNIVRRRHKTDKIAAQNYFKLVSMFDVHKTVEDIMRGHVSRGSEEFSSFNLLSEIVPRNRTCEDAGITYKPHCVCPK